MNCSVSVRKKPESQGVISFLKEFYPKIFDNITTVFGFADFCFLYGGRVYQNPDLYPSDIQELYDNNISIELPLTNQHWGEHELFYSRGILQDFHKQGNIISCFDGRLAKIIKQEYPLYKTKASVTGLNIGNSSNAYYQDKIESLSEQFDFVVLPTFLNDKLELLHNIPNKDQIVIFASCGCSANCPKKTCYEYISYKNIGQFTNVDTSQFCSKNNGVKRPNLGFVEYNIKPLIEMGFKNFKYLRKDSSNDRNFVY